MRCTRFLMLVFFVVTPFLLADGQDSSDAAQPLTIIHNTWSSGAPMPTSVAGSAAAVLNGQIYVVGGSDGSQIISETQIYNPLTDTWSIGTALPTPISGASAAVVGGALYVFGGTTDSATPSGAVWRYNATTKKWIAKANMPTARWSTAAVVENKIVYVIGGAANQGAFLSTVESYNPATNTWTEEAPMLGTKAQPAAGRLGTTLTGFTIVAADGAIQPGYITADNEAYDATTNAWRTLAVDPTARVGTCFGSIGQKFYDVGGYLNNAGAATNVNYSYSLSTNQWNTTLAPIPQPVMFPFSAVYEGKLYCIGGSAVWTGSAVNNVQIYQP